VFNNHSEFGIVLQVQADCLKVLLDNNHTQMVKLAYVQKKIAFETKGVSGKHTGKRGLATTDKFSNVIQLRTVVKPTDQACPFYNCLGEVRAIFKNHLFVLFQKTAN
jgi:hypothetical protein